MRLGWRARRGGGGGCDPEPVGLVGGRGEIGPWANLVCLHSSPLCTYTRASVHPPTRPLTLLCTIASLLVTTNSNASVW